MACNNGSVVFERAVIGGVITAPLVIGSLVGVDGTVIGAGVFDPLAAGAAIFAPLVLGGVVAECLPSGTIPVGFSRWATESGGVWLTESVGDWLTEIQ